MVIPGGAAAVPPPTPMGPPAPPTVARLWWSAIAAILLALIVLRDISAQLGRIVTGGAHSNMNVLTRPHFSRAPFHDALSDWTHARHIAARLIVSYQVVDLLFIAVYTAVLFVLIKKWAPAGEKWLAWFALLPAAFDVIEDVLTIQVASDLRHSGQHASGSLLGWLLAASWAKWAALLVVIGVLFYCRLIAPHLGGGATAPAAIAHAVSSRVMNRHRVWRRLRVQITVVSVFGVIVGLPVGSALDQLPDLLRMLAEGGWLHVGREVAVDLAFLGLFCVSLWLTGRWMLVDGYADKRKKTRPCWALVAATAVAAAAAALLYWVSWPRHFRVTTGIWALPIVLAVLSVGEFVAALGADNAAGDLRNEGERVPLNNVDAPTPSERPYVERAVRLLAAAPAAIAGAGLVRAFADPLALGVATNHWRAIAGAVVGTAAAVGSVPAADWALGWLETKPGVTGVVFHRWSWRLLALAALVLAVCVAVWPFRLAPMYNATSILTLLLTLVVYFGGWAQKRVELRRPLHLTHRLHMGRRTPVFVFATAVFLLASALNTTGGYHDVRVLHGDGAPPVTLKAAFKAWLVANNVPRRAPCEPFMYEGAPAVPLVMVAAPGGGIRGAYWTVNALSALDDAGLCTEQSVFAASGVSGGAVGLAVYFSATDRTQALSDVKRMSDARPLAVDLAGMLFRDLPASVIALSDGWDDRGALLERAWEMDDPQLHEPFLRTMRPVVHRRWQHPIVALNGTEVSTGCRVIVSPLRVAGSDPSSLPGSCLAPAAQVGSVASTTLSGAAGSIDAQYVLDGRCGSGWTPGTGGDLALSTAALLAGRFPYVSPTGQLYACGAKAPSTNGKKGVDRRLADLDGGAAENSGIATVLDLWRRLAPLVQQENLLRSKTHGQQPLVVPMLLLVDNHYQASLTAPVARRQRELLAPLHVKNAKGVRSEEDVLTQDALIAFTGRFAPAAAGRGQEVRVFRIGPEDRPGVAAPLGWSLSDMARSDLDQQLKSLRADKCAGQQVSLPINSATVIEAPPEATPSPPEVPGSLACLLLDLGQPGGQ